MTFFASWRTALRIAARETRRAKGRSALVVTLIALPVLALAFAVVTTDMLTLTGGEQATQRMGRADARIQWPTHLPMLQLPDPLDGSTSDAGPVFDGGDASLDEPGTEAELRAVLPAGTTILPVDRGVVRVKTPDGLGEPTAVRVDATSPLTPGYVDVLDGRAPQGVSEVALTAQAMAWLEAGLGDTVTVVDGDGQRSFTVVGRVEFPSLLSEVLLFSYQEQTSTWFMSQGLSWLVDTPGPVTWSDVLALNERGIVVTSRAVLENPPPDDEVPLHALWFSNTVGGEAEGLAIGALIAGLGLLEVVLLAGPAFAISARRRQRQLALVAANGGTPAHVRRIVLADGVVLGLGGAAVGILLGIIAAFLARPFFEDFAGHRFGAYRVFPQALAAIAALAIVIGLAAALVPAITTARQNVVAALAGRRGAARSRKRWIVLGIVMIGLGAAITGFGSLQYAASIMLAGLVLGELGLVVCTPALVGLVARIGRVVPLAPRIALRDAARNRAAAAPAISAVMAAVAGTVAIGLYYDSTQAHTRDQWTQELPTGTVSVWGGSSDTEAGGLSAAVLEQTLRGSIPVGEVHQVAASAACPDGIDDEKFCDLRFVLNDLCPQARLLQLRPLTDDETAEASANPNCDPRDVYAGSYVIDDGTALATLTGATGDDLRRAREVLAAGGVVTPNPLLITDGTVRLAAIMPDPAAPPGADQRPEGTVTEDGIVVPSGYRATVASVPGYRRTTGEGNVNVVSPQAVARAGLVVGPGVRIVASTTRTPTRAEEEKLQAALTKLGTGGTVEHGFQSELPVQLLLLIAAAALVMVGAAAVGTALAAADGRADLSTLAAVGASPGLRRGLSVSQSAVIAGLGAVLGSLAGAGAAIAILVGLNAQPGTTIWPNTPTLPVVPWFTLLVVLVVVPGVSILGAGLLTRARLPIERRL